MRIESTVVRTPIVVASLLVSSLSFAQPPDVGLSPVGAQRFGRPDLPNANAGGDDLFGAAFAVGDFDGDGADDLATGAPHSDGPGAVDRCGQVVVRPGIPGRGLDEESAPTVLGQFVVGSTNPAEPGDRFGSALVACNLDGDEYDDLVVGVPFEGVLVSAIDFAEAGLIEVYYGTSAGIVPPADARFREPGSGMFNFPTSGAHYGAALACADFDGDGIDDLAVGMPDRDLSEELVDAGRLVIYPGSESGIGTGVTLIDQGTTGIDDNPEDEDRFGAVLTTGDFDGDGIADLVVGAPGERIELFAPPTVGAFHVLYGAEKGLATGGNDFRFLTTNPAGGLVSFASVLAAGNFDADPYDDLAVGSPFDGSFASTSGTVLVYSGSASGLDSPETFAADTIIGDGASLFEERFGSAVAAGDFDRDGADDLVVGIPFEDVFGENNGAIVVVRGTAGAGLVPSPTSARQINHGLEGFPGDENEDSTRWGSALSSGDFDGDGHSDLAVGAQLESESLLAAVGTASVLYGALFADGFDSGGFDYWSDFEP